MTITELIKELEKIKAEHGDLEVGIVGVDNLNVNFNVCVCKSECFKNWPEKFEPDTKLEETMYCEIYAKYSGEDY